MAKSKTTTAKKTKDAPVESVAVPKATGRRPVVGNQQQKKAKPQTAVRRAPVQYTPRIPTARCPWC